MKLTWDTAYLIWSYKHNMWWGADQCGYAADVHFAGVYSLEEANEIVDRSRYIHAERSEAQKLTDVLGSFESPRCNTVMHLMMENQ